MAAPIKRGAMNSDHFRPAHFAYDEWERHHSLPGRPDVTALRHPHPQPSNQVSNACLRQLPDQIKMYPWRPAHHPSACRSERARPDGGAHPYQSQPHDPPKMHGRVPDGTIKRMSGGGRFLTRGLRAARRRGDSTSPSTSSTQQTPSEGRITPHRGPFVPRLIRRARLLGRVSQ